MSEAESTWRAFSDGLLDLLYPRRCPLCSLLGPATPCPTCVGEMKPFGDVWSFETEAPLEYRAAIYDYQGRGGQAVRRLKYSRSTSLGTFMAAAIAKAARQLGPVDLIVPVPIHWSRLCERGFNQAERLCGELDWTGDALVRVRRTRPQVGLNVEQRRRNLNGAFRASPLVNGKTVLLIDDVVTSGGTAIECARALVKAGAISVGVLSFAGDSLGHNDQ